ncbi:MAG TPA: hypothetical protein VHS55_08560, partial [Solirubrobacteraceae bacterium]|nr:hypothetical protein [Solirubrobacteraceae bacterium]
MSACAQCGAPMQEGQDWCLQCGAGAPGSLDSGGPGWRTGVAILGATGLLVVGASVAAYAALTKPKPKPKVVAVAIKPANPVTSTPLPGTTGSGGVPGIPTTVTPAAPKIPTQTPTPKSSEPSAPVFPEETKTSSTTKSSTESSAKEEGAKEKTESGSGAEPPSPILLDTNAASVYNPYSYPASLFGDPSLTIDGEAKTAWTAQVQPEKAPHMAEGLLLDLKSPQKLGSAAVKTSTTGATVEIYGANGATLPASITDAAWTRLVGLKVLKKKEETFTLKTKGKFRY